MNRALLRTVVLALTSVLPAQSNSRPNIIVILADDMGIDAVSAFNPKLGLETRAIDRLAREGMSFTDAHSTSGVCTPTRYGLLTGRYNWRSRLKRGIVAKWERPLIEDERLTLPEMLRARGYDTACIGKWHLGWNWPKKGGGTTTKPAEIDFTAPVAGGPIDHGFDHYFGDDVPNWPPYAWRENDRVLGTIAESMKQGAMIGVSSGPSVKDWDFRAVLAEYGNRVARHIRERAGKKRPFFLYFPMPSPHTPIAPHADFRGKSGISEYADFLMQTDAVVDQLMTALRESGQGDDTLVFFTCDNGTSPKCDFPKLEKAGVHLRHNWRGWKADAFEGGHRVPFIVRWPGRIEGGKRIGHTIALTDIMATCAEVVGHPLPANAGEDSASLLGLLRGKSDKPVHDTVVHHSGSGHFAIRKGRWKLLLCRGSGGWSPPRENAAAKRGLPKVQLYDLDADPRESKNLQAQHPELVQQMTTDLKNLIEAGRSTPGPRQKNHGGRIWWKGLPWKKPTGGLGPTRRNAHWASWRGPRGTGQAMGSPPIKWAEETEQTPARNIAWKVAVPGRGISSPIVWRDRIYITTAIETDRPGNAGGDLPPLNQLAVPRPTVVHEFAVIALNRDDGSVAWRKTLTEAVPHEGGHRTNSHASSSPVTDGEHIYANLGSRGLFCLDMNGRLIWNKDLGRMTTRRQYGEASSPTVHGNFLIVNWDHEGASFIACFDKRTGKELWRQPRDEVTSWSTPIVVQVDGRPQIVINATTASRGYDLRSGKVIWSLPGMTVNCIPIPIHVDGVAYLMSGYRGQMLQAVKLAGARGDLSTGPNLLWSHRRNTSYVPSAAVSDGRIYFLRGNNAVLSCLDTQTGEVVYEGHRLPGLRQVYASPMCADGRLYVTSRDGVTKVIRQGPSPQPLATNTLDDAVDASMAIVDDEIYIRGHRHLYCISRRAPGNGPRKIGAEGPDRVAEPPPRDTPRSPFRRVGSLGQAEERTASISVGDLDGDGHTDLVVANGRHWAGQNKVFLNDGKGAFPTEGHLGAERSTTYAAALADVDGDGDLDAVVGNDKRPSYVMLNDGKGRFSRGSQVGRISNTRSVTLADLDGRHGIDVILTNRKESNLICFNDGKGGFDRQATFGGPRDATINVATGDIDGDGDLDIAVANREGQQNHVYVNDGKGAFPTSIPYGAGADPTRGVALVDVDGDGHLDIVNANIGRPNAVYFGDGAGRFDRSVHLGATARSYAVAAADVDGDGRTDVIVANAREPNAIYLQRPGLVFQRIPFGPTDGVTYGLAVGDWNGDGRQEIATANSDGKNLLFQWIR